MPMTVKAPEKLFKYQPFSAVSIENLANNQLFFSRASRLNDPFEFHVRVDEESTPTLEEGRRVMDWLNTHTDGPNLVTEETDTHQLNTALAKEVGQALQRLRTEKGVACFSAIPGHPLMWAHYGDRHQGFCLEFTTKHEQFFDKAVAVAYPEAAPVLKPVDVLEASTAPNDPSALLRLLAANKLSCWSYEEEWRCIHAAGDAKFGYDHTRNPSAVYFGLRMPLGHQFAIAAILQKKGGSPKLFQMRRTSDGYGLEPQSARFQPDPLEQP